MHGLFKYISKAGKLFYPSLLWNLPRSSKILYLTFDDGPEPKATPWVLSQLNKYNAKATFFCIGRNVAQYPEIYSQIIAQGHSAGNHTYTHLNGWKTPNAKYLENVLKADPLIFEKHSNGPGKHKTPGDTRLEIHRFNSSLPNADTKLFRPPYGKIKPSQIKPLQKFGYQVVMWDVISGDYNAERTPEKCYKDVISQAKPGSIIVFHDSAKAFKNLKGILPGLLKYYTLQGYSFKAL